MARHIDHMCQLVGARHVGLALDLIYDQNVQNTRIWNPYAHPRPVKDIAPEELVLLTEALIERGYAEADIRGILGGNWLRIAREIWK
jgi:membrane dipeptidase